MHAAKKQGVQKAIDDRTKENPEIPATEPLSLDSQVSVISDEIGERSGTDIRGVGRCMKREPKKRGGRSRVDVDALMESRVEAMVEERVARATTKMRKEMEEMAARILADRQSGTGISSNPEPSNPL